ncbi:hypothetical protein VDP71_21850, partial [Xanthomonas campestris pv. campestris]|nr:hypothetical protein [Xanthomonas campestris pv. campestris]MEB1270901.1 hypothetical protein [Xanthomonas campestris pv. campestris]MEB1283372.1 hypothetical protein [Xanthomonas campestris pv. campestris]
VQVMLATTATGLFVLGARISSTLAEVRLRLRGEQQALDTAKLSYLVAPEKPPSSTKCHRRQRHGAKGW